MFVIQATIMLTPTYIIWVIYCTWFRRKPVSLLEVIAMCHDDRPWIEL